jgi:hypothetical protein
MQARSQGAIPAPPRRAATPLGAAEEDELAGNREERKLETCARYGDECRAREMAVDRGCRFRAGEAGTCGAGWSDDDNISPFLVVGKQDRISCCYVYTLPYSYVCRSQRLTDAPLVNW